MKKIFIATPAQNNKVDTGYAMSLAETRMNLASNNVLVQYHIYESGSLLVAERNRILKHFIDSDCTHLLCIDADICWIPDCVNKMLNYDLDFVAGCYPARGPEKLFIFIPDCNPDGSIINDGKELIKMKYIPAGFMLIRKNVIEKLIEDNPHLYYEPKSEQLKKEKGWLFFNTEIFGGEFWGEDYTFCRLVRKSGFDIWVNPTLYFVHAGIEGCLMNVLTQDKDKAVKSLTEHKEI